VDVSGGRGESFFYFSCCLNVEQRPAPEYLYSDVKLNFEEGNDNEEVSSFHIDVR
jgi:hypothetical protein